MIGRWLWSAVLLAGLGVAAVEAEESPRQTVCRLIEAAAADHGVPPGTFTRLIWRESSFRANMTSGAGAQGIAQFMPTTAVERQLGDPFDPEQAIPAAAHLLADLTDRFGSLGLAVAAYNAGPTRVRAWLAGTGQLPTETARYVLFVTGSSAEAWTNGLAEACLVLESGIASTSCLDTVASISMPVAEEKSTDLASIAAPWGLQLVGGSDKQVVLNKFARLQQRYGKLIGSYAPTIISTRLGGRGKRYFYRIRIAFEVRAEAHRLCNRLRAAGGDCMVLRN